MRTVSCTPGCAEWKRSRICRQDVAGHGRRGADLELAATAAGQVADRPAAVRDRLEHPFRIGQERAAGVGELHAPSGAHDHRLAQLPLQRLQPRGQRRLREKKCLRGAADAATPHDLHESLDVPYH